MTASVARGHGLNRDVASSRSTEVVSVSKTSLQRNLAVLAALTVAVLAIGLSEMQHRAASEILARVVELRNMRFLASQLLRLVAEAESGKRGYLLVGGEEYLGPYRQAERDAAERIRLLTHSADRYGDSTIVAQTQNIARVIWEKFAEMKRVMQLHESGERVAALDVVRGGEGRRLMEKLGLAVDALLDNVSVQLDHATNKIRGTLSTGRVGVAVMTTLSILVFFMLSRQRAELDRQQLLRQAEIRTEKDRLEAEVVRRTEDLRELAQHLQTAREDERAHLARELHDELGGLCTAAKLDLARIKPQVQKLAPEMQPRLHSLTNNLDGVIALKRRIIEDLRPSALETLGLTPALEILVGEYSERAGVRVNTRFEETRLIAATRLVVYRTVQEALSNCAKYARAKHIDVSVYPQQSKAIVEVKDDGVGFIPSAVGIAHHGLRGMRFRVEAAGGTFQLDSAPGAGTSIRVAVPQR